MEKLWEPVEAVGSPAQLSMRPTRARSTAAATAATRTIRHWSPRRPADPRAEGPTLGRAARRLLVMKPMQISSA
jgi:hypothetical protein